jgi:two-component system, chemotaxis family, protein-glutamate methylesterase/glutaminase
MTMTPIRVLVIDDSAVVRQTLREILLSDPEIAEVEVAADGVMGEARLERFTPDVITLDLEMPRMDGLTFLKKLMEARPRPVVVCSSHSAVDNEAGLRALDAGAVDIITKPRVDLRRFFEESRIRIIDAVKAAAGARVSPRRSRPSEPSRPSAQNADAMVEAPLRHGRTGPVTEPLLVVGASTGGTSALLTLLQGLPADGPATLMVQHMPARFTGAFAERLDSLCPMRVREAADGDRVTRGAALLAPGDRHIILNRAAGQYRVSVKDGPLVCRHRPSVEVLFRSAARYAGANAVGVILTGMGSDGANGMKEMHDAGAVTLAQDRETCVVFGMPNTAIARGGVDQVLPIDAIAPAVLRAVRSRQGRHAVA